MITVVNCLNKIYNAQVMHKKSVMVLDSKLNREVLQVLEKHGFVNKLIKKEKAKNLLGVELKYLNNKEPAIQKLEMISRPSLEVCRSFRDFKDFISNKGILIISTSKGIMSNREAFNQKLGGKIICKVA